VKNYIVSITYYPKLGYEKEFLRFWKEGLYNRLLEHGSWGVGIYHNVETGEYYAYSHFQDPQSINTFFQHPEIQSVMKKIENLSSTTSLRETLEVLSEEAS
jgi:quinol monooxygenase YgiN